MTGDRPTGPLHLGHYVGSLQKRVELQNQYDKPYIMIADLQALTDNAHNPQKVSQNVLQVAFDYLAVGLEPNLNTFFIQSLVPELAEFTILYLNFVTLARVKRNPTVKEEMQQKGFGNNVPVGFLTYPISQVADITAFRANIVPVGEDQLPMIEQTNEIVRHINNTFNVEVLTECKALLSKVVRLPGIDGKAKMGKSMNNAIYLGDSAAIVDQKIMSMFTDPGHIRVDDPGDVEINTVFKYLDVFDPDLKELEKLKEHYQRGGLGDVVLKKHLIGLIQEVLEPIRLRRQVFEKDPYEVMKMLKTGSEYASSVASKTLKDLRNVLSPDLLISSYITQLIHSNA